jgi:hypothetical protein
MHTYIHTYIHTYAAMDYSPSFHTSTGSKISESHENRHRKTWVHVRSKCAYVRQACVHACTWDYIYTYIHTCIYIYLYIYIYICIYTQATRMCACQKNVCSCTCVHVHETIYIYIYTHTHTYTYICTHNDDIACA